VTSRQAITWGTASAGAIGITTTFPLWTETATETESYVTLWDASTAGNFLLSGILTTADAEQSGYTFTLNVLNLSLTGLSAYLADKWLMTLAGTAYSASAVYAQQHIGAPGTAGTSNLSAITTRDAVTLGTPAAGVIAMTNAPVYSETATETEEYISLWDASTAGNFLLSSALTTNEAEQSGYTFTLNSLSMSLAGSLAS
jgi:hypothetical protein